MRSLGLTLTGRVSPTVSFLTTDTLRRSMIPRASARPQSMGLTTVDKSSDFTWPPVGTRMDSSGLSNRDVRRSNGGQWKACPVPTQDRASPPQKILSEKEPRSGALDERIGQFVI